LARQPEAYIDFEVYEDATNYLGISQVTLPNINYITQQLTGAGIAGNVNAVLIGMVDAMTATFNFRSALDAAANLLAPTAHHIDLRAAEQYWDTQAVNREVIADKYVMVMSPMNMTPGTVAPASLTDTSCEFNVTYYAAFKNGEKIWEIDPWAYVCYVNGVDYMEPVRRALGK